MKPQDIIKLGTIRSELCKILLHWQEGIITDKQSMSKLSEQITEFKKLENKLKKEYESKIWG